MSNTIAQEIFDSVVDNDMNPALVAASYAEFLKAKTSVFKEQVAAIQTFVNSDEATKLLQGFKAIVEGNILRTDWLALSLSTSNMCFRLNEEALSNSCLRWPRYLNPRSFKFCATPSGVIARCMVDNPYLSDDGKLYYSDHDFIYPTTIPGCMVSKETILSLFPEFAALFEECGQSPLHPSKWRVANDFHNSDSFRGTSDFMSWSFANVYTFTEGKKTWWERSTSEGRLKVTQGPISSDVWQLDYDENWSVISAIAPIYGVHANYILLHNDSGHCYNGDVIGNTLADAVKYPMVINTRATGLDEALKSITINLPLPDGSFLRAPYQLNDDLSFAFKWRNSMIATSAGAIRLFDLVAAESEVMKSDDMSYDDIELPVYGTSRASITLGEQLSLFREAAVNNAILFEGMNVLSLSDEDGNLAVGSFSDHVNRVKCQYTDLSSSEMHNISQCFEIISDPSMSIMQKIQGLIGSLPSQADASVEEYPDLTFGSGRFTGESPAALWGTQALGNVYANLSMLGKVVINAVATAVIGLWNIAVGAWNGIKKLFRKYVKPAFTGKVLCNISSAGNGALNYPYEYGQFRYWNDTSPVGGYKSLAAILLRHIKVTENDTNVSMMSSALQQVFQGGLCLQLETNFMVYQVAPCTIDGRAGLYYIVYIKPSPEIAGIGLPIYPTKYPVPGFVEKPCVVEGKYYDDLYTDGVMYMPAYMTLTWEQYLRSIFDYTSQSEVEVDDTNTAKCMRVMLASIIRVEAFMLIMNTLFQAEHWNGGINDEMMSLPIYHTRYRAWYATSMHIQVHDEGAYCLIRRRWPDIISGANGSTSSTKIPLAQVNMYFTDYYSDNSVFTNQHLVSMLNSSAWRGYDGFIHRDAPFSLDIDHSDYAVLSSSNAILGYEVGFFSLGARCCYNKSSIRLLSAEMGTSVQGRFIPFKFTNPVQQFSYGIHTDDMNAKLFGNFMTGVVATVAAVIAAVYIGKAALKLKNALLDISIKSDAKQWQLMTAMTTPLAAGESAASRNQLVSSLQSEYKQMLKKKKRLYRWGNLFGITSLADAGTARIPAETSEISFLSDKGSASLESQFVDLSDMMREDVSNDALVMDAISNIDSDMDVIAGSTSDVHTAVNQLGAVSSEGISTAITTLSSLIVKSKRRPNGSA